VLLRPACLTNTFALLRLLPITDRDTDIEILVLRHQIALLQRQPSDTTVRFRPADMALLAVLLHRLPRRTLHSLRLLVRADTILRWHRDLLRRMPRQGVPTETSSRAPHHTINTNPGSAPG
jgi:putative transposase